MDEKLEAVLYIRSYAVETWRLWEVGYNDHKVGKRLAALSGCMIGYDAKLDASYTKLGIKLNVKDE